MEDEAARTDDLVSTALASLRVLPAEVPACFADRVMEAVQRRGERGRTGLAVARFGELGGWARRQAGRRRRALASSALVMSALAIGLEARHLRRSREEEAA